MGEGREKEAGEREAIALGLRNVCFVGSLYGDALKAAYRGALAFVLPSLIEAWGLVVNEAMASGTPVVVSSIAGCVQDLVDHGRTGMIFRSGDALDLAKILKVLCADQDLRQRLAENGRARVADYSPDRFGRCAATLFSDIIRDGRNRRWQKVRQVVLEAANALRLVGSRIR